MQLIHTSSTKHCQIKVKGMILIQVHNDFISRRGKIRGPGIIIINTHNNYVFFLHSFFLASSDFFITVLTVSNTLTSVTTAVVTTIITLVTVLVTNRYCNNLKDKKRAVVSAAVIEVQTTDNAAYGHVQMQCTDEQIKNAS